VVHFRVTDPQRAIHAVASYDDRLYSDVQLAARRSLASMSLEEILTNRNRLSEDILKDVKEIAAGYGVSIIRADVKDLIFPGNLQEIMNRVLTAERLSEAQLVEARTNAETQRMDAQVKAATRHIEAEAQANAHRLIAQAEADAQRIKTDTEVQRMRDLAEASKTFQEHPMLSRLHELECLAALGKNANARIYIGFDNHRLGDPKED
jgi:regulator of protease activity HflC (stomatin/prohibitin superfamily)